jgi:hypothetical protein
MMFSVIWPFLPPSGLSGNSSLPAFFSSFTSFFASWRATGAGAVVGEGDERSVLTPANARPKSGLVVLGFGRDCAADGCVACDVEGCEVVEVVEGDEAGTKGVALVDNPDIRERREATRASSVAGCGGGDNGDDAVRAQRSVSDDSQQSFW